MDLLAVIHLHQGFPEDIWITDKADRAEEWRAELDDRYAIIRDDDGAPLIVRDHQVLALNSYRQDIG